MPCWPEQSACSATHLTQLQLRMHFSLRTHATDCVPAQSHFVDELMYALVLTQSKAHAAGLYYSSRFECSSSMFVQTEHETSGYRSCVGPRVEPALHSHYDCSSTKALCLNCSTRYLLQPMVQQMWHQSLFLLNNTAASTCTKFLFSFKSAQHNPQHELCARC